MSYSREFREDDFIYDDEGNSCVRIDPQIRMLVQKTLENEHVGPFMAYLLNAIENCPLNYVIDTLVLTLTERFHDISKIHMERFKRDLVRSIVAEGVIVMVVMKTVDNYKYPKILDYSTYDLWVRTRKIDEKKLLFITRRTETPAEIAEQIASGSFFFGTGGWNSAIPATGRAAKNQTGSMFSVSKAGFMDELGRRSQAMKSEEFRDETPAAERPKKKAMSAAELENAIPASWREELKEPLQEIRIDACLLMEDNYEKLLELAEDGSGSSYRSSSSSSSSGSFTTMDGKHIVDRCAYVISGFGWDPNSMGALTCIGYHLHRIVDEYYQDKQKYDEIMLRIVNPTSIFEFTSSGITGNLHKTIGGSMPSGASGFSLTDDHIKEMESARQLAESQQFDNQRRQILANMFYNNGQYHYSLYQKAVEQTGRAPKPGLDTNSEYVQFMTNYSEILASNNMEVAPPGLLFKNLKVPVLPFDINERKKSLKSDISLRLGIPYGLMDETQKYSGNSDAYQEGFLSTIESWCGKIERTMTHLFNMLYGKEIFQKSMQMGFELMIQPQIQALLPEIIESIAKAIDSAAIADDEEAEDLDQDAEQNFEAPSVGQKRKRSDNSKDQPPSKKSKVDSSNVKGSKAMVALDEYTMLSTRNRSTVLDQLLRFVRLSKDQKDSVRLFTQEGVAGTSESRVQWLRNQLGGLKKTAYNNTKNIEVKVKCPQKSTVDLTTIQTLGMMGVVSDLEVVELGRRLVGKSADDLDGESKREAIKRAAEWRQINIEQMKMQTEQMKAQIEAAKMKPNQPGSSSSKKSSSSSSSSASKKSSASKPKSKE